MKSVTVKGCKLFYHEVGAADAPCILWAHGWGQSHQGFARLLPAFEQNYRNILIDFPGFGQSPEPPEPWGTAEYAQSVAALIRDLELGPVIWIGHSFGCRVALQMAAHAPELMKAQALIAGAGLKPPRPLWKTVYIKGRIYLYKALKKLIPLGLINEDWLKRRFGSSDYQNSSGTIRQIFVKVVNEDLVDEARQVQCPTLLLYGENDTETPPAIGEKLHQLIAKSEYIALEGQDHYSVLGEGRHAVTRHLNRFIRSVNSDTL